MKHLVRIALAASAALAVPLTAQAADLRPVYKAPIVMPFNWTGIYVGIHGGAAWGTKEWSQSIPTSITLFDEIASTPAAIVSDSSHTVNGLLGGGQVGFNYQVGWAVFGVEFQASAADVKGKGSCGFFALWNCSEKVDSIATLAGRLGFTYDHAMVFVKGGGAWAHDKFSLNFLNINIPGTIQPSSISGTRSGWMIGTGIELALDNCWSAKVEYDYMDLGTKRYVFNTSPFATGGLLDTFDITQRLHLIKFGLNYRFSGGSVVARY